MPPQAQVSRTFNRAERAQTQSSAAQLSLLDRLEPDQGTATPALPDDVDDALDDDDLLDEEAE